VKIAIVTPTWNRPDFLRQTHRYVLGQNVGDAVVRWFVLDDSATALTDDWTTSAPVDYRWLPEKTALGRKRNMLNDAALAWGADYVADMVAILSGPDQIAGSGPHYYYHIASGKIVKIPAARPQSSCNHLLCYRASFLKTARSDDSRNFAEEASFLKGQAVAQHPDIAKVHFATIHPNNTVSKRNYILNPAYQTALTLDDFAMDAADRQFYLDRTKV
jgi:hypothetical protein